MTLDCHPHLLCSGQLLTLHAAWHIPQCCVGTMLHSYDYRSQVLAVLYEMQSACCCCTAAITRIVCLQYVGGQAEEVLLSAAGRLVISLGRSLLESLVEIPLVKLHMPDLLQMLQDALQVAMRMVSVRSYCKLMHCLPLRSVLW